MKIITPYPWVYLLLCAGLTTPSINRVTFMTNMSQAPATEKKRALAICWDLKSSACRSPLYAFALITLLLSHFYNALPTDIVGGFAIMFIIGAIFGEIGKRLPIFNKYIGGAPVMIFRWRLILSMPVFLRRKKSMLSATLWIRVTSLTYSSRY